MNVLPPLWVRRCAALAVGAVAVVASSVERSSSATQALCAPSGSQPKVGSLTRILHTTVFVDRIYVGAVPCELVRGNVVRTDSRGEAVLRLSVAGRGTKCVVLPLAKTVTYPSAKPGAVVDFASGRSWCSTSGGNGRSFFSAGGIKIAAVQTMFGVDISRRVTVKVYSGSLRVNRTTLRSRMALVLSTTGKIIRGPSTAVFDAEDGLALAQLR